MTLCVKAHLKLMDSPVFNAELAKKFLEKIETMPFEEMDERASHAPSSGISGILNELPALESCVIKYTNYKIIQVQDFDELVKNTYNRPYSFQQQDGCKDRRLYSITVPCLDPYDFENDTVPEVVNHSEMSVSFKAWLERDPKQELRTSDEWDRKHGLVMWYERNFYPSEEMIINDLHSKGLLEEGSYGINIDW